MFRALRIHHQIPMRRPRKRIGEDEDGCLAEVFIDMHKEGSAFRLLMHARGDRSRIRRGDP